jgi:1,4-alpha-glucan branching enzyme
MTETSSADQATSLLLAADPSLRPYRASIRQRLQAVERRVVQLLKGQTSLSAFANGHNYFGLHFQRNAWVLREWAPHATALYLIGDCNNWRENPQFAFQGPSADGVWELELPAAALAHQDLYRLRIHWPGGSGERIPAWVRRVVQDPETLIFNAQVWQPAQPYRWCHQPCRDTAQPLLIYEAHIGMAQEEGKVGSFPEFTAKVLPRIAAAGYNTLQLMAIAEHPYYGSFGYQVSSFFAVSSRFGTPEQLKELVDVAHDLGLRVTMDLIHSHAVNNEVEGLSRFDGSTHQFFHAGSRGRHHAWDSRCFDYGKIQVLHFLLSNCRFWLDEFRFDGFRFDGVTSMLYLDHGLERSFDHYDRYFDSMVDEDALVYLALANRLIHELNPHAVTIAEDISGMPGLALATHRGGYGFDYRFAMGIPDFWIRLVKDHRDEDWPLGQLWHELTNRRPEEKTIAYAESHDQALVGDQTLIFRLIGDAMYAHMHKEDPDLRVDRGIALHKLIRLVTLATAGDGYLNFMGNEFGHPEWIDFPRQGNDWSFHYARRQWLLADNPDLKYFQLARFDHAMLALAQRYGLLSDRTLSLLWEHDDDKVLAFQRGGLIFVFNFHCNQSWVDYAIGAPPGEYVLVLDSDATAFGGHGRLVADQHYCTLTDLKAGESINRLQLYLPNRTALVLARCNPK